MNSNLPGRGWMGWLGRQVGYVKRALGSAERVVYRSNRVEETEWPRRPDVKLRRTVVDEVIVRRQISGEEPRD